METYVACAAMRLDDWRPGFTRVIFKPEHGDGPRVAIELPANMYRAVTGGPSCAGKTLADFAPLFSTGLVRRAPAGFSDYFTRGRIALGETFSGRPPHDWELKAWIEAQPAA